MKIKSVIIGNGSVIHIGIVEKDGSILHVLCGAEFSKNQNQRYAQISEANEKHQAITCKRCLKAQVTK